MTRFALAAALAAVIGSQADAQILYRNRAYVSPYAYPSTGVVTSGYYYTPSTVLPAAPIIPATSSSVVVPSYDYSTVPVSPVIGSGYVTPSYGYYSQNYYTPSYYAAPRYGVFGRRW